MPFLRWINEYRIAILCGLLVGAVYVYSAWDHLNELNFASKTAGIAVGTIGAITCFFLLWKISERDVWLGALQDERKTLLAGLTYTIVLSLIWLAQLFNGLPLFTETKQPQSAEWLYHDWGVSGRDPLDCDTTLILRRGRDDQHILFVTGAQSFQLQIVDASTQNMVATDEGTFTLQGGSMYYDQMENKTFARCDR
jgi:hypothetical protein